MVFRLTDTRNKYNARKAQVDGITFDSIKEADRYRDLKFLEMIGEIRNLKIQPSFELQEGFRDKSGKYHRPITYRADFQYMLDGQITVEDVKGHETAVFKIKKKMFLKNFPEYDLLLT